MRVLTEAMLFQKILLPIDFSPFSAEAVVIAEKMARRYNAQLTMVHVLIESLSHLDESETDDIQSFLHRREVNIQQQFRLQYESDIKRKVPMDFVMLRGTSPADALREYLQAHDFDLVLMARYGDTGFRQSAIGGVTEKLVQVSPASVMIVGRSQPRAPSRRLLVPVDFSIYSRHMLSYAAEIARVQHARITLMHVVEQEIHPSYYTGSRASVFETDPALEQSVRENLQDFIADLVDESLIEKIIVKEGVAHQLIVDQSKSHYDLLMIATHGLTGLEYLNLGGTAEKVVRWSQCPLLVVKCEQQGYA